MRIPERLAPLMDVGIITEVRRPLMSGKEAQVYLVEAYGDIRVAKVYKEAAVRSFKNRADYVEGRKTRNSRSQRAMDKKSKFGKSQMEDAWRSAEVDAIYKLRAANVRVPEPFDFYEGVLVMELISAEDGLPAPRLVDVDLSMHEAAKLHAHLLKEVQKMLVAGVVHGDLSDFNVLMGVDGAVIIDFPQAVDPAHNRAARKLLIRDVDNVTSFLAKWVPAIRGRNYGQEMWELYEAGRLTPETELTGRIRQVTRQADVAGLLREIDDVADEAARITGGPPRRPRVTEVVLEPPPARGPGRGGPGRGAGRQRDGEPGRGGQEARFDGPREGRGDRFDGPRDGGRGERFDGPRDGGRGERFDGPRDGGRDRADGPRDGRDRFDGPRDGGRDRRDGAGDGRGDRFDGPRSGRGDRFDGPREGGGDRFDGSRSGQDRAAEPRDGRPRLGLPIVARSERFDGPPVDRRPAWERQEQGPPNQEEGDGPRRRRRRRRRGPAQGGEGQGGEDRAPMPAPSAAPPVEAAAGEGAPRKRRRRRRKPGAGSGEGGAGPPPGGD